MQYCAEPVWFSISPNAFDSVVFLSPILGHILEGKLYCHLFSKCFWACPNYDIMGSELRRSN